MRSEDVVKPALQGARSDFYVTAPAPCPYLPGRIERKVFSFLAGPDASAANATLTRRGFRRSQNIIYVPSCEGCRACTPVRILVDGFEMRGSRKRILARNRTLSRTVKPAKATSEQFSLLRGYLDARHPNGGMADMTALDYAAMIEETAVDTMLIEYREPPSAAAPEGRLVACALTDRLEDGLSMVYSFFEPDDDKRSLGRFMILDHVQIAREAGLSHVYLGYWVPGSPKMHYKIQYQPLEMLGPHGWEPMTP